MQASSFNESILTLVDELTSTKNVEIYIKPNNSKHQLSTNDVTSTFGYSVVNDYPSNAASLEKLYSSSSAPAATGQVTTTPVIIIRTVGHEEKEITANIGQAKVTLHHVGGVWDVLAGKVTDIPYPVWPTMVQDILVMVHPPRAEQLSSLLI
jgi:hypothetical protein